jgi:serine/threonine protein phosphatase PrpC
VVIALPDVTNFKINPNQHDFIIIASDGVYDRLTNEEVASLIWDQCSLIHEELPPPSIHDICGRSVDRILRVAMSRGTSDNVSAIMIALPNFKEFLSKPNPIPVGAFSRNHPSDKSNHFSLDQNVNYE